MSAYEVHNVCSHKLSLQLREWVFEVPGDILSSGTSNGYCHAVDECDHGISVFSVPTVIRRKGPVEMLSEHWKITLMNRVTYSNVAAGICLFSSLFMSRTIMDNLQAIIHDTFSVAALIGELSNTLKRYLQTIANIPSPLNNLLRLLSIPCDRAEKKQADNPCLPWLKTSGEQVTIIFVIILIPPTIEGEGEKV